MALDPDLAELLRQAGEKVRECRERTTAERDRLILTAWHDGAKVVEIARAVGLSHPSVIDIIDKPRT